MQSTTLIQAIQTDLDTIEEALKAARKLAHSHSRGGLNPLRYKTQSALDALERLTKILQIQQPQLF